MSGIFVVAEQRDGRVNDATLELLNKGKELASKAGLELGAVLLGDSVGALANDIIAYGAGKVYLAEHSELKQYRALPYARVITDIIRKEKPEIVLFAATTTGRELAPRIAMRLGTGLTADCTELDIGDHTGFDGKKYDKIFVQVRPAFGGDVIATIVTPDHRPQMATVRPGVFGMPGKDSNRKGEVVKCSVELKEDDKTVTVIESVKKERKVDLKSAKVIVSGGRGCGQEGFKLVHDFAKALGAEVGASRVAVDANWISYDHQVGLSGQTVKPEIYIACGISGTVHHLAGMKDSKTIIAINKDKDAQIFKVAHYGIIGDLGKIIPKLIEKLSA